MWLDESSSSERLILPRNISVSKLFVTSRARFPALIFQINEFPPNWRMIRKCCNYGEYDRFLNVSCIFAVAVEPIHLFDARHEGGGVVKVTTSTRPRVHGAHRPLHVRLSIHRCCILSPLFDACDERCSIPFASIREHARVVLHCSILVHPLKRWRRNLFVYLLFVKTLEFYILIILYNIVDLISCIDFNRFTARYINTVLFFFFTIGSNWTVHKRANVVTHASKSNWSVEYVG